MRSATASERLQALWYGQSSPPWPLRLLSLPFALIVRLRRAAYSTGVLHTYRLGKPVIVIGNVSVGGTGKTPLAIWLVEQLRAMGLRAGVVLRGYGGSDSAHSAQLVTPQSEPAQVGDEAVLIRRRTDAPVAVGRNRVGAAQLLLQAGVDVIVADDGLQHLRLARDYEIAVVDAARGLGNGYLLPAGPLREPVSRLSTVSAIVVNGTAVPSRLPRGGAVPQFQMRLIGAQLRPLSGQGEGLPLTSLRGKRVHALAGIGHPQRFFTQLAAEGLEVIAHPFPDHHTYSGEELQFADGLPLLMTEKDAVKCAGFAAPDRWYLPVVASFAAEQTAALLARLQAVLTPER